MTSQGRAERIKWERGLGLRFAPANRARHHTAEMYADTECPSDGEPLSRTTAGGKTQLSAAGTGTCVHMYVQVDPKHPPGRV